MGALRDHIEIEIEVIECLFVLTNCAWTRLRSFTQTLTCTLVERLFTLNRLRILTTSTGTVELRFLKRGCPRSDSIVTDLYHNGPLREQFPPQIMSTMLWIEPHQPSARFVIHQSLTTTVVHIVLLSKSTLSPDRNL